MPRRSTLFREQFLSPVDLQPAREAAANELARCVTAVTALRPLRLLFRRSVSPNC